MSTVNLEDGSDVPAAWTFSKSEIPIDKTVVDIFEEHVAKNPQAPAIRWSNQALTYDMLNKRANMIAHFLRSEEYGVKKGDSVAFFMEQSASPIIAALAIVKAGGTYIPLDPSFQNSHVKFVLEDTGAKAIICDETTWDRCMQGTPYGVNFLHLDEDVKSIETQPDTNPESCGVRPDTPFHVIYTSGSTGKPKGIEILHQGFIRLSLNTNWIKLTNKSKMASMANYAFDASSLEIWSTLLNGAEIVILPRSHALNPRSLKKFLLTQKITMMFITTQLFHFVARELPDAFATLDQVIVGGEALSPEWAKAVLMSDPPTRLTNGYGPAENTCCTTYHDVELKDFDEENSVPIGIPVLNSEVLILNEKMEQVMIGQVGEVCISGLGLARGYVNRAEITAEKFVNHPYKAGERIYRSGDLARWAPNGNLYFEGRRDRQVKIRGFRIELSGIEAVIHGRKDLTRDSAVIVREDTPGNRKIVAYCVPNDADVMNHMEQIHHVCSELRHFLEGEMPSYMIPSAFILVSDLPITPNGKLNDKALPTVEETLGKDKSHYHPPVTETEKRVAQIWSDLLNLKEVSIHSEFHDLGGDSLNAAKLLMLCEDIFSVKCPAYEFFYLPTVANLARIVDLLTSRGDGDGGSREEETKIDLQKFVTLDPSVQPTTDYEFKEPCNILLTGATGFLGAYLLRDLLHDVSTECVYALVRADSEEHALKRIRSNLETYGIWEDSFSKFITCLVGDFSKPLFDLDTDVYNEIVQTCDTVIHNGAKVDYTAPYTNHAAVNVEGTVEIIKFCFEGKPKALHFLSTLAVFGPIGYFTGATEVAEDADMKPSIEALQSDMGYAQSKWVAEQVLWLGHERGLQVSIYRPGFIICDGKTGVSNVADFMVRCTISCIKLGYYPILQNQSKELLTVDFASSAIVALAKKESQLNKTYHLCRPDVKKHPSSNEYFEMLGNHGYQVKGKEFRDWVDMLSRAAMDEEGHPMLPLMPMMAETVRDNHTRWEIYNNMPIVQCHNTTMGLEGTGVTFATFGHELMAKYLKFLVGKELLPSSEPKAVDRMTMNAIRSSRKSFKSRPSGRRMSRLSSYLSEAGSDRASIVFSSLRTSSRWTATSMEEEE